MTHLAANEFGFCDRCNTALYKPKRFWFYLGYDDRPWPWLGTDEFHRRTLVITLLPFPVRVVIALWWKDDCETCPAWRVSDLRGLADH